MFPRFVIANHTAVINYVNVAFCVSVVVFAQASITKYHRLGGLNNRNLFSHSSGGWNSEGVRMVGLHAASLTSCCVLLW